MASTMKDISKRTGLSLATISKYVNGGNVREENRAKIDEAIETLNFKINEMARGLKTNKSRTIGIIVPEINNVNNVSLISNIEPLLREKGYGTLICDCNSNYDLEKEAVSFLLSKRVDGIVNIPLSRSGNHLQIAQENNIPCVVVDIRFEQYQYDCVLINNDQITKKAILHFIENGHKNIGMVLGPEDTFTAQLRLLGYMQAFLEKGMIVQNSYIVNGSYTTEASYRVVKNLLNEHPDVTAIFASDTEMTIGAITALNELDIKIPDDISFIGFDNNMISKLIRPKLTVIQNPVREIAKAATDLILQRIENPQIPQKIITTQAELIFGKSVKKFEDR